MTLIIESPGFGASNNLQHLVKQKSEHLDRICDRITRCLVIFRQEHHDCNQDCISEAKVSVPGKVLFASDRGETFEIAFQKVMTGIDHQLRKYKEEKE